MTIIRLRSVPPLLIAVIALVACIHSLKAQEKIAKAPPIKVTDTTDEEMEAFKIKTEAATYFYQKAAAGFSSVLDKNGIDWINFHPGNGSAGEYRGIPNLGPCCHPGYDGSPNMSSITKMVSSEENKVVIESESTDGKMKTRWEFYQSYAQLTVIKAQASYWFLYEGTPAGKINTSTNYFVTGSGDRYPITGAINKDISPEWAYFGDQAVNRVLYFIHHADDTIGDQYWLMNKEMTVFGFGRTCEGVCMGLKEVPKKFTFGFSEDSSHAAVSKIVNSILNPSPTSVKGDEEGQFIKIVPNPGCDILTVYHPINGSNRLSVEIFNIIGQQVYFGEENSENETFKIDISSLTPGIFLVNVYSEEKLYQARLVKE